MERRNEEERKRIQFPFTPQRKELIFVAPDMIYRNFRGITQKVRLVEVG